ncbi:MAG: proline--tRNA ligase [Armatimonadetes bacterium]|nr:proline--tRNA ligase [Armatimonadota bacterium]
MRASQYYMPTLRQAPAEADLPSHKLLLRGGFIRQVAAGVFSYLPLGYRVLRKVEQIVREEMNRAGAVELHMPVLSPSEWWQRTGRWEAYGDLLFRVEDRQGRWFALGPTHEEVITSLVARDVSSYKQLPVTLYQIQVKFRDELRPRAGLIRGREFLMKDAYSFDLDQEGLDRSYQAMFEAYKRIFERLHLPMTIVEAEGGVIGGSETREFMLLSEAGEDTIFRCDSCDYQANAECARSRPPEPLKERDTLSSRELVETPGMTTIEQVSEFLGCTPEQLVKTLIYYADGRFVAALVRGDRDLNEAKLYAALQAKELRMATPEEIQQVTGAPVGFSGPVGLPDEVLIVADEEIAAMSEFVVGANQADAHLVGVDWGSDFEVDQWADLRTVRHGDPCPRCERGYLAAHRAIELGHLFKLGTKYSEPLGAYVDAPDGRQVAVEMGCYGIGVSRIVAALVEAYHDDDGILWPLPVAPFQVVILALDAEGEVAEAAARLAEALESAGWEVLLDDRDERPGVKFKDADLIGFPLQVVVGKKLKAEGMVEVRRRRDRAERIVAPDAVDAALRELAEGVN